MADGEIYVLRDNITVEINSAKIINPFGVDTVMGCTPMAHDLNTLINLWIPKTQMMQVLPDQKWCKVCGDARPHSYFDVVEWDTRGKATKWNNKSQPTAWDGIKFATKWHDTCRQCVNAHDPKLAKEKYCSSCKVMHPRLEFADDVRYRDGKFPNCIDAKRRAAAADYARKKWLEEGVAPGTWGGHRERQAV